MTLTGHRRQFQFSCVIRRKYLHTPKAGHCGYSLTGVLVAFFPSHGRASAGPDQARKRRARSLARLFIAAAALCVVAMPLPAAERETRVLILNGTDPTLPAFLLHDAAMREGLAKSAANRFQFFSEALDAHKIRLRQLRAGFFVPAAQQIQRRDLRRGRSGIGTSAQFRTQAQERIMAGRLGFLLWRAATGDTRHRVPRCVWRASSRAGP